MSETDGDGPGGDGGADALDLQLEYVHTASGGLAPPDEPPGPSGACPAGPAGLLTSDPSPSLGPTQDVKACFLSPLAR